MTNELEPILDPELPIVDPHHHLWDRPTELLKNLPPLEHPFMDIIREVPRYLLDELLADRSVIRTGAGRRGDPYRYVRASAIDSAGAAVAPAESIDDAPTCTTCGLMVVAAEGDECQYCAEGQ